MAWSTGGASWWHTSDFWCPNGVQNTVKAETAREWKWLVSLIFFYGFSWGRPPFGIKVIRLLRSYENSFHAGQVQTINAVASPRVFELSSRFDGKSRYLHHLSIFSIHVFVEVKWSRAVVIKELLLFCQCDCLYVSVLLVVYSTEAPGSFHQQLDGLGFLATSGWSSCELRWDVLHLEHEPWTKSAVLQQPFISLYIFHVMCTQYQ